MRIAIATEGNEVSPHFGRCSEYTLVDIVDQSVSARKVVPNPGHEPGLLPRLLKELGASCVVAGGMGPRAQALFDTEAIRTVTGVSGKVDDVIQQLIDGVLAGGESTCDHPGESHCDNHGEAHPHSRN